MKAPSIDDLFGGLPADQRVERFEAFKSALSACHKSTLTGVARGEIAWGGNSIIKTESVASRVASIREDLSKSLSADQIADVSSALSRVEDATNKDWSLTNPLNSVPYGNLGLVPYNLDPALAYLVPRSFILRNSTSRISGVGQAHEFRRILGVSNSNTGGVANLNTFFSSASVTDTFGAVTLNRPKKISYASDRKVVSFKEQGISDSVTMQAQFAGQGYADLRQLSHTSAIWAHMLGEERNLLGGRTTALSTSGLTFTGANDATGTGLPATSSSAVAVTLSSSFGETASVSAGTVTNATAGQGVKVTYTGTIPAGTLAVNVYVTVGSTVYKASTASTASGVAGLNFVATSLSAAPSTDLSFSANSYDGYLSVLTDPTQAGYVKNLNGALSTTEPGAEFQDAFASLFASVIGDPDMILTTAVVRRNLAKSIQQQGNPNGYRLNYETGSDGITIGSVVTGIQNESTGSFVDLVAHPYMPAGVALVHSKSLPFPDSGVAETVQVINVQDMLVLEWPVTQLTYDLSTYQYGAPVFRAPAWSGAIVGITG